jgi:hypothetical protein
MNDSSCDETGAQHDVQECGSDAIAPHAGNNELVGGLMPNCRIRQLNKLTRVLFAAASAGDAFSDIHSTFMAKPTLTRLANSNSVAVCVVEALHRSNEKKISYGHWDKGNAAMKGT